MNLINIVNVSFKHSHRCNSAVLSDSKCVLSFLCSQFYTQDQPVTSTIRNTLNVKAIVCFQVCVEQEKNKQTMAILKNLWLPLMILAVTWVVLISLFLRNASHQSSGLRAYIGEHVSLVCAVLVYQYHT